MHHTETFADFYKNQFPTTPRACYSLKDKSTFNVHRRSLFACKHRTMVKRRDFYKISFIQGTGKLHYAHRGIHINSPALLFSNPLVPYAWEAISSEQEGYFCIFTEDFVLPDRNNKDLANSPLFRVGTNPVFFLDTTQQNYLSSIFERMLTEVNSDYPYKQDLLRNYVHLLIHEALKMQPNRQYFQHGSNAAERITHCFMELLSLQFPLETPAQSLAVKTPADFAKKLSIHVNHLNRSVKEVTQKTTSEIIAKRIVEEAKSMLTTTTWNIAEIAYCLGFNEAAYFNNFFKKQVNKTPGQFRKAVV